MIAVAIVVVTADLEAIHIRAIISRSNIITVHSIVLNSTCTYPTPMECMDESSRLLDITHITPHGGKAD